MTEVTETACIIFTWLIYKDTLKKGETVMLKTDTLLICYLLFAS